MKVLFLGTGPSLGVPVPTCSCSTCRSEDPRDKRLRSSVYVVTEKASFLIDCGPDFRQQALANNLEKIDFILITHKHNDHIGGIDDIRPFNYSQGSAMSIYGNNESIKDIEKRFYYSFDDRVYPGAPKIDLNIIKGGSDIVINGLQITVIEGLHGEMPVLGFRIGDFTYLTDFKYIDDKEIIKIRGTRVLVLNALLPKREHKLHFNLSEALTLAGKVNPEKIYLTHLSHRFAPYIESQRLFPDNVYMTFDGLEVEI